VNHIESAILTLRLTTDGHGCDWNACELVGDRLQEDT